MIVVYDSQNFTRRRKLLEIIASSFITFSIVSLTFYFFPILKEEIKFWNVKKENTRLGFGDLIVKMDAYDAWSNNLDPYFSIHIPKIDAKANIVPNIDPGNPDEYLLALKKGVAHARGASFPGQESNVYLFSHSTNSPLNFSEYNAVFYLLRKLEKKDKIYVYFLNKKYVYEVTDIVIADANDTSWLNEKGQGERLILQTCDPPGTSLKRLIVIANPVN
ncbi:hypothetical protein A2130_04945 [Candidatus Woesebacteria bacterium GWC2_33_12]|uniref:Sortase family protein n=1 Tax=Candidatus Woesebacteria bacterium GW2011_GWB1_33_22 TaxID=1618566 RepID=A0A0G0C0E8_9BACT|nr:MAG: hypothetical protein UR29_C0011G0021 [Candidatus Woesebacteria bacterium GW2011_GWC2_33_12]KKP41943.1 MAG: hypothetical protein UR33_C0007G0006 [Candidatus Woesebacteria bacterium GW2011_GWA2_33_20]KKP44620.1 MAG: hypothetical protein UR35_C0007G0036 [Candidatus Woesebacteria bacterium GW2011_GWB1_33_22]KKP46424.1 MAG: Sortase family protein [Microgenomates group bacterium GW2011_GWC1_33_28]KKP50478.1 MAG: hypothetical protein UR41_C0007G0036 [Candidatus Woesebacteria bacterium GW2011_G